jgi:Zn-dependent protease with chaperone function
MFNNVLYFIVVLLVFNISSQESKPEGSLGYTLFLILVTWLALAAYAQWGFRRLLESWRKAGDGDGRFAGAYHGLLLRLSISAVLIFALDVHLFSLRYWLQAIPGFKTFSVLQGSAALGLFLAYLSTVWYFAWPAYREIFSADFKRWAYVTSNVKFNIPILFPWIFLTLLVDLASLVPSKSVSHLLNTPQGQIVFFAVFLSLLTVFMPPLIQTWWGCRPFPQSGKVLELEAFLREKSFRYRGLLQWPLLEGRVLTAGIMGVVPRFRYILVTDGLMEALSVEELKAVLAHEMGHAKHRHLLFYVLFLLGYMVISFGIFEISFSLLAVQPFFMKVLESGEAQGSNLFYIALSLPILATMVLYFRYVMGSLFGGHNGNSEGHDRLSGEDRLPGGKDQGSPLLASLQHTAEGGIPHPDGIRPDPCPKAFPFPPLLHRGVPGLHDRLRLPSLFQPCQGDLHPETRGQGSPTAACRESRQCRSVPEPGHGPPSDGEIEGCR